MKAFIIIALFVGAVSAIFPVPSGIGSGAVSGMIRDSLSSLDISNFDGVQTLFRRSGDSVLHAASRIFAARFKDSLFLRGQSFGETTKNFIANAKEILSKPLDPNWKPGLDIDLLGLSKEDFQKLLGSIPPASRERVGSDGVTSSNRVKRQAPLPASVDWRNQGVVTGIKNQGKCGGCWAFSAIGALESRLAIKTGKLPVLSEQNLIDCAKEVNGTKCCNGCNGGWMSDAYSFVELNDGINPENSYPFEAKDATCRQDANNHEGHAVGYEYTAENDEEDLKRAVAQGPVAVGVSSDGWSSYKSGVFRCRTFINRFWPLKINHGVVVVGYGTNFLQGDFWIVKNSWGSSWGENGYIRIARNDKNQCGIAGNGIVPKV